MDDRRQKDLTALEKIDLLRKLVSEPNATSGEHSIWVKVSIYLDSGSIWYGIGYKLECGEFEFRSLDEAIVEVRKLRARMGYHE